MEPLGRTPVSDDAIRLNQRIDEIADKFEAAWSDGQPPRIADYLGADKGELRYRLVRELVSLDLESRWKRGERKRLEDYVPDFPELLEGDGALPDELVLWVQDVRARLGRAEGRPPAKPESGQASSPPAPLPADGEKSRGHGDTDAPALRRTVRHLQLLEVLGEGGFGVVYRAWDAKLRRSVAVSRRPCTTPTSAA